MEVLIDIAVFLVAWGVAQLMFQGYAAHVSWTRRAAKLAVMLVVLYVAHGLGGRYAFYGVVAFATVGMMVLHLYWFHVRHGIHWRTAEPREKYLELIGARRNAEPNR